MWPFTFKMMCIAFIIYHLATIAVMSLKIGITEPKVYLMLPAVAADFAMMYYMLLTYQPVCEILPLFTAVSADKAFGDEYLPSENAYQHPSLRAPDTLLPEADIDAETGLSSAAVVVPTQNTGDVDVNVELAETN